MPNVVMRQLYFVVQKFCKTSTAIDLYLFELRTHVQAFTAIHNPTSLTANPQTLSNVDADVE
jgi:hypothetical protein